MEGRRVNYQQGTAPDAVRSAEIPSALQRLQGSAGLLEERMGVLVGRLSAYQNRHPEKDPVSVEARSGASCEHAAELESVADRLDFMRAGIDMVLSRLEL